MVSPGRWPVGRGAAAACATGVAVENSHADLLKAKRGRSSVVERQLPKLYVVGSIPIARSKSSGSYSDSSCPSPDLIWELLRVSTSQHPIRSKRRGWPGQVHGCPV